MFRHTKSVKHESEEKPGIVRVVAGRFKGRKLKTPGEGTHPMGEREKNALFNMISAMVPGAFVLDAYAGSGALGIEALSRGAAFALFIDKDPRAAEIIDENLRKLKLFGLHGGAIKADTTVVVRTATDRFSIVFADPPYDKYDPKMVTRLSRVVAPGGILVTSTPEDGPEIKGMKKIKSQQYARAHISVYRWADWEECPLKN